MVSNPGSSGAREAEFYLTARRSAVEGPAALGDRATRLLQSCRVVAVQVHDLGPRLDEVTNELLAASSRRRPRPGAQLGVEPKTRSTRLSRSTQSPGRVAAFEGPSAVSDQLHRRDRAGSRRSRS